MRTIQDRPGLRNHIFLKLLPAMAILFHVNACSPEKNGEVPAIGKDGDITAIVLPTDPGPVTGFAASELRDYLREITGISLRIIDESGRKKNEKVIRLSLENDPAVVWDGFHIDGTKDGIVIGANKSAGILYGVYQLLEEAGCSFVYPGKDEEVIPEKTAVRRSRGRKVYKPVLEHRGLTPYGLQRSSLELGRDFIDWMAKNKLNFILVSEDRPSDCPGTAHGDIWKEVSAKLLPELQKRGFVIEMSEHTMPNFFPRSLFQEHPEWFSLIDGKRKAGPAPYFGQMCYSNKDAVDYYANALSAYAVLHPEFDIIGTWPLDGSNYCQCKDCQDPQTIFNAIRHVAEKVKEVRPDITVEHLAYRPMTWQPPLSEKIPSNLSVLWCPDNGVKEDLAREWIHKAKDTGGVYQFEYYMGDNYRSRANLWLRPENAVNVVKYANQIGYRGVISLFLPMENWWRSAFNSWFYARACWNNCPGQDSLMHEYSQRYYGRESPAIEKVFKTLFTEIQPEPFIRPDQKEFTRRFPVIDTVSRNLVSALDRILAKTTDPGITKNILRLKAYIEYFRLYAEVFTMKKPGDLDRLVQFSEDHPDMQMVIMYPEYIRWRLEEYF